MIYIPIIIPNTQRNVKHTKKRYVIEEDFEYKGFQCCVILQREGYRCGYVNVGRTSLKGKDCDDIGIGGFTYANQTLVGHKKSPTDWWIGWDYAPYGDGYIYSQYDVKRDCMNVVEQLLVVGVK
ncbi:MAG: hypothetical protein IKP66_02285 [Lachnospiraceae bacterium]|nr:hypothetical protein [Lachnospiraceae bacterium]